jgi:hypothetical protein
MTRVYLVMNQSSLQERLTIQILRDLGLDVTPLEATALAPTASTALFVFDGKMRRGRAGKKARRTPRMLRVGSTPSVAASLDGAVADFASGAFTCIALRKLSAKEMRDTACLKSLRTALYEAVRVCRKVHNVAQNAQLQKAAEERSRARNAAKAA